MSQQGALTYWRGQRSRLVRTWKESKLARGTHFLERAEVKTGQDIKMKLAKGTHKLERAKIVTSQDIE